MRVPRWLKRLLGMPDATTSSRRDYVRELTEAAAENERIFKESEAKQCASDETMSLEIDKLQHLWVPTNGDAPDGG